MNNVRQIPCGRMRCSCPFVSQPSTGGRHHSSVISDAPQSDRGQDVCGPVKLDGEYKYALVVVDEAHRLYDNPATRSMTASVLGRAGRVLLISNEWQAREP